MSSFLVQNKTINNIISYLYLGDNARGDLTHIKRELNKLGFSYNTEKEQEALGKALYNLNIEALKQRYGNHINAETEGEPYKYEFNAYTSIFQALKNAECLVYQCSEGNIPTTKLYKWLKDFINKLRAIIVDGINAYKLVNWE